MRNALAKRYEVHFDQMTEKNIIAFMEMWPNKMQYLRELVMKDYRKYKRAPSQFKKIRGLQ